MNTRDLSLIILIALLTLLPTHLVWAHSDDDDDDDDDRNIAVIANLEPYYNPRTYEGTSDPLDFFAYGELLPFSDWELWRTEFSTSEGKLWNSAIPRSGFAYGDPSGADGDGSIAVTHVFDRSWRDYRYQFRFFAQDLLVDDQRYESKPYTVSIYFRLADAEESEHTGTGMSGYRLNLATSDKPGYRTRGQWTLNRLRHINTYGDPTYDEPWQSDILLASGDGSTTRNMFYDGVNNMQIDVVGTRIVIFVNGALLHDALDEVVDPVYRGDRPSMIGGVGIAWPDQTIGWIDNLSVRHHEQVVKRLAN